MMIWDEKKAANMTSLKFSLKCLNYGWNHSKHHPIKKKTCHAFGALKLLKKTTSIDFMKGIWHCTYRGRKGTNFLKWHSVVKWIAPCIQNVENKKKDLSQHQIIKHDEISDIRCNDTQAKLKLIWLSLKVIKRCLIKKCTAPLSSKH